MLPDMKKSEEPHYLVVKLKYPDGGLVAEAHCSRKAGSGGHCNHVFALLYQLNDYNCPGYKDIPSDVTCTSQPQSWHIPRAKSMQKPGQNPIKTGKGNEILFDASFMMRV